MRRSLASLSILAWLGILTGCSSDATPELPQTVAKLRELAVQSRDEAKAARETRSPKEAAAAAERAEAAAAKAAELLAATEVPSQTDRTARQEAAAAARQARRLARLADEDRRLRAEVNGWKGTAYRTTRKVAWPGACNGLALAAEQAAKVDPDTLPQGVRDAARCAAAVASQYTDRAPTESGQPDWPAVAADLRQLASSPPPSMLMGLALALALGGQKDFGLYEIELIDPAGLTDEQQTHYHLVKGLVYSMNGLSLLGGEEVGKIPTPEGSEAHGPELLAGMHLLMAFVHLRGGEYEDADRHTVLALRASPNNVVAVSLTGEQLAASGEYEKAAKSLEEAARGSDTQWLAERIARRARELRDEPGKSDTLLHDDDFVHELMLHYLAEAAKRSKPAAYLERSIAAARSFSKSILELLPGGGKE
jgi:tetratricopeptide (TPR) repeat protein